MTNAKFKRSNFYLHEFLFYIFVVMKIYLKIFTVIVYVAFVSYTHAQDSSSANELIQYTSEYKFIDGIFLNFQQVKNNSPIEKQQIIFDKKVDEFNFFERVLGEDVIKYQASSIEEEVMTRNIWGYADKGVLYIRWSGEFYRIFYIGTICHFIAYENVYRNNYNDPFMYSDPFYSPMRAPIQSKEMRQFFLDFETGQILDYSVNDFLGILMRDKELYDEYAQLKKRKKRQMMFFYLRKYNEKHPLFMPNK